MATDPIDMQDDLGVVVARARRRMTAAGSHKAPTAGVYQSPLAPDEQEVIMRLLRDGTYHDAATRVTAGDAELANQ